MLGLVVVRLRDGLVHGLGGRRVSAIPARSQTARASAISRVDLRAEPGSVHTGPTESPVRATSGLVAELKTTFVHCGPRASPSAWVRRPPSVSRPGQPFDIAPSGPGCGSNGPNHESPGRVVADHAGRDDRAGGDDAAADDPGHQLGDHLLVAEPVLHADHGGARRARRARRSRPRAVCSALVATMAEVAGRELGRVGAACTGRVKSASPVTRSPSRLDRRPRARPRGRPPRPRPPGTRARCAAYRLPIAPQPTTATRTGPSAVRS